MRTVRHILDEKGYTVACLTPNETVMSAISMMADQGIGSLLVIDQEGLLGIVTERDYARKVALMDRKSSETTVGDIMGPAECVSIESSVPSCMEHMTRTRSRHLVVVEDNQVVGVVSIGDLVKAVMDDQQFEIDQLQHYVSGDR